MCHCSFDATFSPDWQHLRSIPHMSIFPQAFCCNKRALSSLPLPTMSINAILRYALHLGMSSLSEWRSRHRGPWNLSLSPLRRFKFFSLICIHPRCSDSRRDVSLDARQALHSLYEHASVCTRRCYLALLFFQ